MQRDLLVDGVCARGGDQVEDDAGEDHRPWASGARVRRRSLDGRQFPLQDLAARGAGDLPDGGHSRFLQRVLQLHSDGLREQWLSGAVLRRTSQAVSSPQGFRGRGDPGSGCRACVSVVRRGDRTGGGVGDDVDAAVEPL